MGPGPGLGPEWVTVCYVKHSHCNFCGNLNGSYTLALYQSRSVWLDHEANMVCSHCLTPRPINQSSDYTIILHNPFSFISICRSWCQAVWTHPSSDSEGSTLVLPGRFRSYSPGPTSDWPAGRSGPSPPPPVCSTWGSSSLAPLSGKGKCQ